jgi:proton-dependent oligopeptide transporter, POT family
LVVIPTKTTSEEQNQPFPRVFMVANGIELLERLAFYGVYINLSVYLASQVGLTDREIGTLLGLFAIGRAWIPVATGAIADIITFRISLVIAFSLYSGAYLALFTAPTRPLAYLAVLGMALGGGFMKPIITACVKKFSPPGRQAQGFAIFYAMVNAGSVIGKVLTAQVRTHFSLVWSIFNSVIASLAALVVTLVFFREPESTVPPPQTTEAAPAPPAAPRTLSSTLLNFWAALSKKELALFLVLVSGYYLLIEQFYQTFPTFIVRAIDANAPREYITLINPLSIAVLQLLVVKVTKRLDPLAAMATGIGIGGISMLCMGMFPSLLGACASFFVFALAEMVFSPRYYQYVSSFAPKGQEGLYMGLSLLPFGVGGLAGGLLSGRLIELYLPKGGPHHPLYVWGTYAVIGFFCSLLLWGYRFLVTKLAPPQTPIDHPLKQRFE